MMRWGDCFCWIFAYFFSSSYLILLFQFQQLRKELEKRFPGMLKIDGEGTPTSTGWFEVTVDGKLVHSKKNGDGFVDKEAKLQKIVLAIEVALRK
ncbi:seleno W [Pelobates cultripes]|uniref:Seleno W n=2 Tax=Pelobates cultripes TaxID=61616 RepID=A0AAD1WM42_PELCU|nr:seleno W [Pelobates cultripes]